MSKRICTFIDNWLTEFKTWLEKVFSSKAAYCKLCQLSFDVSKMEIITVTNHAKAKKKKKQENFFRKSLQISFFTTNNTELLIILK